MPAALQVLTDDLLIEDAMTADADNRPQMRQLRTRALLLAIECWLDSSQQQYATAIARATGWLETMRPAEAEEPDWLQLRLLVAQAHKLHADEVAAKNPRDDVVKTSRETARRLAHAVARRPGEFQEAARQLVAEIPGGVAVAKVGEQPPPENFQEARVRATDAIAEMQSAEYLLQEIPDRLPKEQDAEVRTELETKLAAAPATVAAKRQEARENLLLALELATVDTTLEDLNLVRRLLAFLYYLDGQYYDAAVMGEFVARRFPGSDGARLGARIALSAYLELYQTNPAEEKEFETNHIVSLANYMVETWSGTPEAGEAINTLIPFLIRQGRLDKAARVCREHSTRFAGTRFGGTAHWRSALARLPAGHAGAAPVAGHSARRGSGGGGFEAQDRGSGARIAGGARHRTADPRIRRGSDEAGGRHQRDGPARRERAGANLCRHRPAAEGRRAAGRRNDRGAADDPAQGRGDAVRRAARTVLPRGTQRTGLGADEGQEYAGSQALVTRIQGLISQLREQIGDAPEDQKRLVDIFYSLAVGMQRQLQLLENVQDRLVLSEGFQTFLNEVRGDSQDVRVLNWVAESFMSLGNGLQEGNQPSDQARACFRDAVATFDQILKDATKYRLAPDQVRLLTFRKAIALRDAQQYEQSTKLLTALLEEDNGTLEYQKEAARTYQLWAAAPAEGIRYLTAVRGTKQDPQSGLQAVWGWSRISKVVQRERKYRDDFYEARYNWALCHFNLARRLRKESDRQEFLKQAEDVIVYTHRLYPALGGQKWYGKYHTLLKEIQQARGKGGRVGAELGRHCDAGIRLEGALSHSASRQMENEMRARSNYRWMLVLAMTLTWGLAAAQAQQFDSVLGSRGTPTYGEITSMSPTEITISTNAGNKQFAVNDIQRVTFKNEPRELRIARDGIKKGQLESARSTLDEISTSDITRPEILQDIEFYKAYCDGRLALTGGGDKAAAVRALRAFEVNADNKNSYHYFEAMELLGDLAVALASYENAVDYYGKLGQAPWAPYQLRANVLQASALVASGNYADAVKQYDLVLAASLEDAEAREQKLYATLGKAVCLAQTGQAQDAIASVMTIIEENDSRDKPLLFARAYNALGTCYVKAGQPQDALLAFLHVDLLFNQTPEEHAEALYYLSDLWRTLNKAERAIQARSVLENRYSGSPWANRK